MELTADQGAALAAYWTATTPKDEREAFMSMMRLGLPNASYIDGARRGARSEWRRLHPNGVPCDGCVIDCARLLDAYTDLLSAALKRG
jgi:hypothetical protein